MKNGITVKNNRIFDEVGCDITDHVLLINSMLPEDKRHLPFVDSGVEFIRLVAENPVIIVSAEPGTGKSTMAPLALLRAGFGDRRRIAVTEPRRMAATLLSHWVSQLNDSALGDDVGYHIGKERELSDATRLVYMTEGVLLRQLQSDPMLMNYDVIVVDEAHERGLLQDLLLAFLKEILAKRSDLKVVITSATIDEEKFSMFFDGAPVLKIPGRMFPVDVYYAEVTPDDMNVAAVMQIDALLAAGERGDFLVFMPDQVSIQTVIRGLEKQLGNRAKDLRILPLYGTQTKEEQSEAFKRDGRQRIIVATNIAETSVTIDGVQCVIDSGLIKVSVRVDSSVSALQVVEHSRAGCDQRKGRAGRTQAGKCYRLYSQKDYENRDAFLLPEILRVSLDQTLLNLRCKGYPMENVIKLDLPDKPEKEQWVEAQSRLQLLGALTKTGKVTQDGAKMDRFHMDPMLGRMILEGIKHECLDETVIIAACLSVTRPIFVRPTAKAEEADASKLRFNKDSSDLIALFSAWEGWYKSDMDYRWAHDNFLSSRALTQVDRIRGDLLDYFFREGIEITRSQDMTAIRKAVASGLMINLARLQGEYNYFCNDRTTFIYPGSVMMKVVPPLAVCTKIVQSSREVDGKYGKKIITRSFMHGVHAIEESWLPELVPADACKVTYTIEKDYDTQQCNLVTTRTWNGVFIERKCSKTISETEMAHVNALIASQIANEYDQVSMHAPSLHVLWEKLVPENVRYAYGEERLTMTAPLREKFAAAIAKKTAGLSTIEQVFEVIGVMTVEDVLIGEELEIFKTMEIEKARQEAEKRARETERDATYRATMEAETEARRKRNEVYLQQEALRQAEQAPLRAELAELKVRERAFLAAGSYSKASDVEYKFSYGTTAEIQASLDSYRFHVERTERENESKFEMARKIYADVLEQVPVCPLCSGIWNDAFVCDGVHDLNRLIAKGTKSMRQLIEFRTNKDEQVAEVLVKGNRIELQFRVGKNSPWMYGAFKSIVRTTHVTILPEALAENREMILGFLAELDNVKKALETELAWVETLKQGVASGEIIRLTFKANARTGLSYAEYNKEEIKAPSDDLSRYPEDGQSWWCHVIPGNGPTKIALCRKVGTTTIDIDQTVADILDLFPDLPRQLLQ